VQNLQKLDRGMISKKHRGFFAKFLEILIYELFSNGKGRGPGPRVVNRAGRARSIVDRRRRAPRVPERNGALTGVRPPAAPVHQSSPVGAQKGERSTGSSARASPELGRRRGGRATAVQNRRRQRSVEARHERGEKRREAGRGAVKSGGGAHPFIGVGGAPRRVGRGLTLAFMALTPLKTGGAGLRGKLRGQGNEGGVAGKRWRRG
jgi:hypothetical protein